MNNGNMRQTIHKMIFGKDALYYNSLQIQYPKKELFISWNFKAALGNLAWCMYKRSYLSVLLFSIFGLMIECLLICGVLIYTGWEYPYFVNPYFVFYFIQFLLCGLFGDSAYLNLIAQKVERLKRSGFPDDEIIKRCQPNGIMAVLFCSCIFIGLIILLGVLSAKYMGNL